MGADEDIAPVTKLTGHEAALLDNRLVLGLTLNGHHRGLEDIRLELIQCLGGANHDFGDLLAHELGRSLGTLFLGQCERLTRSNLLKD